MRLREISNAIRTASEIARAGQQIVDSLDRKGGVGALGIATLVVGMSAGFGIGAVIFSKDVRKRLAAWLVKEDEPISLRESHQSHHVAESVTPHAH